MFKKINLLFLILLAVGFAANVDAMIIDFRLPAFQSADGQPSKYFGSYGLTVQAAPTGSELYHDTTDGFGVRYFYENDEIEGPDERLHLSFDSSVRLRAFLITDLFYEPFNWGGGNFSERGFYSFDNATWTEFVAATSQTPSPASNGELDILFASQPTITDIWFKSLGLQNCGLEDHEFSVAQIEVDPVPEPATMLLLGSGLIAFAGIGRRKILKRKKK
jgi:hypothetical protein